MPQVSGHLMHVQDIGKPTYNGIEVESQADIPKYGKGVKVQRYLAAPGATCFFCGEPAAFSYREERTSAIIRNRYEPDAPNYGWHHCCQSHDKKTYNPETQTATLPEEVSR